MIMGKMIEVMNAISTTKQIIFIHFRARILMHGKDLIHQNVTLISMVCVVNAILITSIVYIVQET